MNFKNMSLKKKILLLASALVIVAAVVIVIVFFVGRNKNEDLPPEEPEEIIKELPIVDAPDVYRLEGLDSILALPVGKVDTIVVREEIPEVPEEEPGIELVRRERRARSLQDEDDAGLVHPVWIPEFSGFGTG